MACRMGVVNRDIKLENIMLKTRDEQPILKVCDFGYSINENHSLPKTAVGTPGYTGTCTTCTQSICLKSSASYVSCNSSEHFSA